MKLDPEGLAAHLQAGLKPVYIISGDETLLVQEASTLVRDAAAKAGYQERRSFDIDAKFNWDEFHQAANELSLFSAQRLIELRMPTGKPGDQGNKALQAYAGAMPADDRLMIVTGKLDKRTTSSAWFKALDAQGAHITLWPIARAQLPRWIKQRMQQAGINADAEAVAMLADLVDGNLLAAMQEIEKLKLAASDTTLTPDMVKASVSDSSRYNMFELVDTAMSGNAQATCKMLHGLKSEGSDALTLLWSVSREIRQLGQLAALIERGASASQAMQQHHIWRSKQRVVGAALQRFNRAGIEKLTQQLARIDLTLKGAGPGNGWDQIESVLLTLAGTPLHKKSRAR